MLARDVSAPDLLLDGRAKFKRRFDGPIDLADFTLHDLRWAFISDLARPGFRFMSPSGGSTMPRAR
nr:hypothetical protein [uncultured bacterium]